MSLFHDIKLKRRKVDTHCNSDGEIGADVNTSSPESLNTDNHVKDLDSGSASGASTSQTYLSEDGISSLGSGSPHQMEVMCSDNSANRSDRETSPPPETNTKCKGSPDNGHVVNCIVESPQHERRNSVFDGGGGRNEGPEGLDLSRNKRDTAERNSTPPSSFEEHNMSILRLVNASYKPPLVMGDISNNGSAKPMIWSTSSNERMYENTNSLPANAVDSMKQVNPTSPTKVTPISGNNHACSPLSQQMGHVPVTSAGNSGFPFIYNSQSKSVLSRALTSHNPCINSRGESMLGYVPSSSRAPYYRRESSPVGFTRYYPSNGLTNGETKPVGNVASSSPGHLTDSQALNLTVCTPVIRKNEVAIAPSSSVNHVDDEDEEQPMVCMICEDKATGLHYGIITCEGCKGFFKRTVQNKRVYTCVADGNCEITKAQRNRCQYCRFQKCLRQGMVLAAVREDRMPGGRNSGAVYNLYKVKYKKHKKGQKNGQIRHEPLKMVTNGNTNSNPTNGHTIRYPGNGPEWTNGQILKAALTSPNDILQLRHNLESWMNSSRDRQMTPEQAMGIITQLIECDDFEEIATVKNLEELKEAKAELSDKLCQIGDNIVYKLVQWTKRLPFYLELPVTVHTQLLSHKWHELLVLTTSAYVAIRSTNNTKNDGNNNNDTPHTGLYNGLATNGGTPMKPEEELQEDVGVGLCILHSILGAMVNGAISLEQLRLEAGHLVEQLTQLSSTFRKLQLCLEEYVCLKVVAMLNQEGYQGQREIEIIQERYLTALKVFVENRFPEQSGRLSDLLSRLPEIQSAGELLLHTKMFFVPLFLNTNYVR